MSNLYRGVDGNLYTGDATSLQAQNRKFWVQLTSYDGSKWYAWTEVQPTYNGTFVRLVGGRSGTFTTYPAFCSDQYVTAPISTSVIGHVDGTYVELQRAYFDAGGTTLQWVWVFCPPGLGLTTQTINNSITITDNDTFTWIINNTFIFEGPGPFIFNTNVNFYQYFNILPIVVTDPTTPIIFNPGTAAKLRIVTGGTVLVTEQQLGGTPLPEIQNVWVVNSGGGTFQLTLTSADDSETATTVAIAWNAAAGTVQTALNNAAATLGAPYTMTVTGSGTVGTPWVVTFSGTFPYRLLIPVTGGLGGGPFNVVLKGIDPGLGKVNGRILFVENVGPGKVTLQDMNVTALAAIPSAAIDCPLGVDYIIYPDNAVILEYDAISGWWRFMHPTLGVGDVGSGAGVFAYATNLILFQKPDFLTTDNLNGSVTISIGTLTSFQVTGSTTTSANDTWTDGATSLTIPSDGTYFIFCRVTAHATNTSGSTVVVITGRVQKNGVTLQEAVGAQTFSDKEAACSITLIDTTTYVAGDVVKAGCKIFMNGTTSFDYVMSYLRIGP